MEENKDLEAQTAPEKMIYAGAPAGDTALSFAASVRECIAAPLMLLCALCYVEMFWASSDSTVNVWLCIFTASFLGLTEFLCQGKKFRAESLLWLAGVLIPLLGILLKRTQVWEEDFSLLFMHGFAIWYVISRNDLLLQHYTGKYLPIDGINAVIVLPFKNIFLKLRVLWYGVTHIGGRKDGRKFKADTLIFSALAVVLALALFGKAVGLLTDADSGFADLMKNVADFFRFEWSEDLLLRLIFAIPVSAYLFGLTAGAGREKRSETDGLEGRIEETLGSLRKVPAGLWNGILAAFLLLYVLFFAKQLPYFLGGFTGTIPKDTLVSTYAREGFFELCKVVAVNFTLLWLVTRMGLKPVREANLTKGLCGGLLLESLLLAAVAFSKLLLYMNMHGLTVKRLQASWLVVVLAFGCLAAAYTLFTGKKSFRAFLHFAVVSLLGMYLF